jgi:hypothetical protein
MAKYSFTIPSFHITKIRSAHTDTLFASTSLRVSNANGGLHRDFGPQGAALGDRKAGGGVDLTFGYPLVDVPDPTPENPDGGSVIWTFLLVNAGHVDATYVPVLNKAADAFAGALAGKVLDPGDGGVGTLGFLAALGVVIAAQEALNLLTADCDGQVASGAFVKTAAELAAMTPGPSLRFFETQPNPGSRSAQGCGENSFYEVNYQIDRKTNSLREFLIHSGIDLSHDVRVKDALHLTGRADLRKEMGLS